MPRVNVALWWRMAPPPALLTESAITRAVEAAEVVVGVALGAVVVHAHGRREAGVRPTAVPAARSTGTKGKGGCDVKRIGLTLACAALALLLGSSKASAIPCSSAGGCSDCENNSANIASCITVSYSAFCSCSISANNPHMCLLQDLCDYTSGSGGGGGGTGGGGGGGYCTRSAGGWCPAECVSCGTVYWN